MTDLWDWELFAGPGGWSEGLRLAGHTGQTVGVEHDMSACRTATQAGHLRICADVATFPLEHLAGRVRGLIGSPPCTSFSQAGHGAGRALFEVLATAMTRMARGRNVIAATRRACARILRKVAMEKYPKHTHTHRSQWARKQAVVSALVLQPLRWILAVRPRWIALEQVPAVGPLWTHLAMLLRELGYSAWAGVLSAEQYGVPQTRKRAILMASLDGQVTQPAPTHQPYQAGRVAETEPDLFGDPLPPPVSMAEALGWGQDWTVEYQRGTGMAERHGARVPRPAPAPAPTIRAGTGGVGTNLLVHTVLSHGPTERATERATDAPAATVYGQRSGNLTWKLRNGNQDNACERRACERRACERRACERRACERRACERRACERRACEPAATLFFGARTNAVDWVHTRPSTTVCADARIAPPGHRDREGGERQFGEETRRVTVAEAAVLQSFRPDYPWTGTKSQQYQQVGNAVPPLLAAAVLDQLLALSRQAATP
jgi:DNA (cytosine-5)-methyltransferase 1